MFLKIVEVLVSSRVNAWLFNNFNDSQKDANELIRIYRQVPADLVNIIEYNPIDFASFTKPSEERMTEFISYLGKNKVNARLRRSRGKDIDAACGQLANKSWLADVWFSGASGRAKR